MSIKEGKAGRDGRIVMFLNHFSVSIFTDMIHESRLWIFDHVFFDVKDETMCHLVQQDMRT